MPIVALNDAATEASARISTDIGLNCFEFLARVSGQTVSVIDAADGFELGDKPVSHSGIPILFPFPNRVREGKFSWKGTRYELPESLVGHEGSGNAIHGFCLDRPWRITDQTEARVTAEFQTSVDAPERLPLWPADAKIEVTYSLNNNCLRADFVVTNPDT
ncbi:MAG: aldose 1-epimerase, partial [Planctomycetaceae bacterium]|nr:aldose 1-epimerase [Planctomycetaceae bacterium]